MFWRVDTGNIILERKEMNGPVFETTKEQDFETYTELKGLDPDKIEMTTFEYGQYAEDFKRASGYKFDPITKKIIIFYLDPNEPALPDPVHQTPLTEQIKELKAQNTELMLAVAELVKVNETDKIETQLAIAELANIVTGGVA
jgi:hypothetical protein